MQAPGSDKKATMKDEKKQGTHSQLLQGTPHFVPKYRNNTI